MDKLIKVENKDGRQAVSARELYLGLGLDRSNWSRWQKSNITENEFFKENIDWLEVRHYDEGNEIIDFAITLDFGKHIAMMARTEKSHQYRNYFIKMEKAIQEVYHISETAIVNNIMGELENKIFTSIDERLAKYEENYRPTHANKININKYIKDALGDLTDNQDVELVKQRILISLNAEAWQDVPYEKLSKSMHLVDESIKAVKSFSNKKQLNLFES